MTIQKAIEVVDQLKPNHYEESLKIQWLSKYDGQLFEEVFKTHEGCPMESFAGYSTETDKSTELLVPEPYALDIYNNYLQAQIDKENGEIERFNQSGLLFNQAHQAFVNYYNRTHMPLSAGTRFLF